MKIGHIIVPAGDLDAQVAFYTALGLTLRFRDGDRYAALTDGTTTIALADASQQPVPGAVVVSIAVDDLDVFLSGFDGEAGEVVEGPHERSALVRDAAGNAVVVYAKKPV